MAYDIGPRIGIEGEAEFKQQLRRVNDEIKTLGTEMKVVTSEFIGSEDSMEAYGEKAKVLVKQIDAQEEKLKLLKSQLEKTAEAYGEGDSKTQNYKRQVNNTTAELNKLRAELGKNEQALDDFGKEAEDAADDLEDMTGGFGGIKDMLTGSGGLGNLLTKSFAVGAVIGGIKELGSAVFELVDSTQEYRTTMASLESSSQRAGYTAEETAATYERLQGVLGDSQMAATATANLQALGLSQDQLTQLTNSAIGAWATYGDSIPIDGLAEAINETIQAGQVTGSFADVLNWAGVNEDEFNEKLQAANSSSERANIVMQELARQGLAEAGQAWIDTNQDIVQANRSTDEMDEALARLGGKFAPVAAGARGFAADVINGLIDAGENFVGWATKIPEQMRNVGRNLITGIYNGINDKVSWLKGQVSGVVDKIKSWFTGSDGFDTHSPSRWSEKVFENVMKGGGVGIDRGSSGLLNSVDDSVSMIKTQFESISTSTAAVKKEIASVNQAVSQASRALQTLDAQSLSAMNSLGSFNRQAASTTANAKEMASAIQQALAGTGVYMQGRKVGQIVTTAQNNNTRALGASPAYG